MTEFSVRDMTCSHCSSTIARAIKGVDSNSLVEIDLSRKAVRITSTKPSAELLRAIQAAGYNPVVGSGGSASSGASCCQGK